MLPLLLTAATLAAPNPARHEKPTAEGLNVLVRPATPESPLPPREPGLTAATSLTGTEFPVLREIPGRVLIRNKVAGFVITGGQDNVQAVAGQMMMFFGELGFTFPQFPFVAHSRGWSAEDMENNILRVKTDQDLQDGVRALSERCLDMADGLVSRGEVTTTIERPLSVLRSRA